MDIDEDSNLDDSSLYNSSIFSPLLPTTISIEMQLSNIQMQESELIERLEPSGRIKVIKCNYGRKVQEGFQYWVRKRISNRGRKKQEKIQNHKRKKQGDGTCMNSQITFEIAGNTQFKKDPFYHIITSKEKSKYIKEPKFIYVR